MDTQNKNSNLGTILVVIIAIGIVVYYLANKDMRKKEVEEAYTPQTGEMTEDQSGAETEVDASLESEIENLDSDLSDVNPEDLEI